MGGSKQIKLCDPDNATGTEMARILGKSSRQVYRYAPAGCPRKENGRYRAADVIEWLIGQSTMESSPGETESRELERFRRIRADLLQMEFDERRNRLVNYDIMMRAWCRRVRHVTSALELLYDRLPPMLVGRDQEEIREILVREFNDMRSQFAKRGKYTPTEKCVGDAYRSQGN
jgi:hypothetical protein